ncbi:MAG: hypothetical protein Kow00129_01100 [Thermoleophilia bacterium]
MATGSERMVGTEAERMTVVEHLTELRRRLILALLALGLGVVVAFIFQNPIFEILKAPLDRAPGVEARLITLSPAEPFMTVLKVSVVAGLLLALPVVLWQFWAFVMPALYESERKRVLPYAAFTTLLFLAGVAFGYFVVLPVGLAFLVGYGGDIFAQELRASEYINFVSMFLLAFGVVFEMPAMLLLLASAGLVNHVILKRVRKYALLGIAVIAMILTPADPFSMLLMMGPLYLLYELGIILTLLVDRRRVKREQAL